MVGWVTLIVLWLGLMVIVAAPGMVSDRTAYTVVGSVAGAFALRALVRWMMRGNDEKPRRASR